MFPKSNENHIACLVVCGVTIYLTFVNDIMIKVCFLLFQLISPFPNKKTQHDLDLWSSILLAKFSSQ